MKKVVYLFGAGASEGEFRIYHGKEEPGTLMKDLGLEIKNLSEHKKKLYYQFIQKISLTEEDLENTDLELLVSLIEAFPLKKRNLRRNNDKMVKEIKALMKEYLEGKLKSVNPILTKILLKLQKSYIKEEEILGILTTNYDDLIEKAKIHIWPNLPLFYLHGSFKKKNWIIPSRFKKLKKRNLRKIWEKAYYLLSQCNTLRIIGSSLRETDIYLLSLILDSQVNFKRPLNIEIITSDLKDIKKRLNFLGNIKSLSITYPKLKLKKNDSNKYKTLVNYLIEKIQKSEPNILKDEDIIKLREGPL
jgi:hypothetical protein